MIRINQGEAVTIPLDRAELVSLPIAEPNSPFFYMAHPRAWTVLAGRSGYHVIPDLLRFTLEPGVSLVDKNGRFVGALAEMKEKGYIVLPHDIEGTGTSYLRKIRVRNEQGSTGFLHCPKWATYHQNTKSVTADMDGHIGFAKRLLDRNVIPPVEMHTLVELQGEWRQKVGSYVDRAKDKSTLVLDGEHMQRGLAAIDAAIEALEASAAEADGEAVNLALDVEPEGEADVEPARPRRNRGA